MVNIGPFVALLPLNSSSAELKPHWLYLTWDDTDACWLTKSALVNEADQEPPAEDSGLLQTQPAPEKLKILMAPHYLSLSGYGFILEPQQIHAYKRNVEGRVEHAWSYQVEETVANLLTVPSMQAQDLPVLSDHLSNRDISDRYSAWISKEREHPLIQALDKSFMFDFATGRDASYFAALKTEIATLQRPENRETFQHAAKIYFAGKERDFVAYLQRLPNLMQVRENIVRVNDGNEDRSQVWQDMTNEQVKTVILTYHDEKKNQLKWLANCCTTMSPDRARELVGVFSDEELLGMILSNAARRDRANVFDAPNYYFGVVVAQVSLERFQALVTEMFSQHWNLYWAYRDKKQAVMQLLRNLNPEQQRWLLQETKIKDDIIEFALSGYHDTTQFMTDCQFNAETQNAFLAASPSEYTRIDTLNDCVAKLNRLAIEDEVLFFNALTDEQLQNWSSSPDMFSTFFSALKAHDAKLRLFQSRYPGFLERTDLDTTTLKQFFADFDDKTKKALLEMPEISALLKLRIVSLQDLKNVLSPSTARDIIEQFGFDFVELWLITEADINLIRTDFNDYYVRKFGVSQGKSKFQTVLLQNLACFANTISTSEGFSELIYDVLDGDASEAEILQSLTQLDGNIAHNLNDDPSRLSLDKWCARIGFVRQFKTDAQKTHFLKIPQVYNAIDLTALTEMMRYPEQKELVFNAFYPEKIKALLLQESDKTDLFLLYLGAEYKPKCRALFNNAEELNANPSLQRELFPEYTASTSSKQTKTPAQDHDFKSDPAYAAHANNPAALYGQLHTELELAIKAGRAHLDTLKHKKPYVHLDIADKILKQVAFVVKQAAEKPVPYALMNQVLYRCQMGIYTPSGKDNLTHLKHLSTTLAGNPSRSSKALGSLLYTFAGLLIIAGLLAAIPLSGGNVLMSICVAAKCNALAMVVAHSAWTALVGLGSGAVVGGLTYHKGFFGQHGLAKSVHEFSEKVVQTASPKRP